MICDTLNDKSVKQRCQEVAKSAIAILCLMDYVAESQFHKLWRVQDLVSFIIMVIIIIIIII